MTAAPRGAQTLPDIIATAFTLVVRHRGRFLVLALPGAILTTGAVVLVLIAGNASESKSGSAQQTASVGVLLAVIGSLVLVLLAAFISDGLVVPAAFDALLGRRPQLRGAWLSLREVAGSLAVGWLVITGGLCAIVLLSAVLQVVSAVALPVVVYLGVRWSFFIQELVRQPGTPWSAFRRSGAVVRGRWWRCLMIHLAILLLAGLPNLTILPIVRNVSVAAVDVCFTGIALWLAAAFSAVARTVLYADIKRRKGERLQDRAAAGE